MVSTEKHGEAILDGLIEALTGKVPDKFANSTTVVSKLIPFQNTAISQADIAELIE